MQCYMGTHAVEGSTIVQVQSLRGQATMMDAGLDVLKHCPFQTVGIAVLSSASDVKFRG